MKLTSDEIKTRLTNGQVLNIKYVRINDEFRYGLADGPFEHKDLVENETPTSAGFFTICKGFFCLHGLPSTSLRLGPSPEDEIFLKSIFQP